jgi:hypothetical protein
MKIRLAVAAATVFAVAACTGTPTSPLSDHMPAGPSFEEGLIAGTVSGDTIVTIPGSLLGDSGEGITSTAQGDTTGRGFFGSGS